MKLHPDSLSRRSFLQTSTAAASAFTIIKPELVRGAGRERLKAGLIGCGGRGTQAVVNLLSGDPNVEVVAMSDVFEDRLKSCLAQLQNPKFLQSNSQRVAKVTGQPIQDLVSSIAKRVNVDPEHRFSGFDAYKRVIASDVDIVMLCAPPGYRPMHFEAAVEAKKHLFAEKPYGTDPVGVRRIMAAAKKAESLKLTVMSGAQRRCQKEYVETVAKIKDGAIGDIVATYAYWIGSPVLQFQGAGWPGPKGKRDPKWSDMVFQNRSWYSFVWICGDQIVEQHLHNIDVCNWVMGTHPVTGGRLRRRRLAAQRRGIRQHLRPHCLGLRVPQRRAHAQPRPAVSDGKLRQRQRVGRGHEGQEHLFRHGDAADGSLRPGAHRDAEEHPRRWTVHQPRPGRRRKHDDLHHGPRIGVLRQGDHLGHDDGLATGLAAEVVRYGREAGDPASARSRPVQVRLGGC